MMTLFLAGCATNRVEMDYGTSYKLANSIRPSIRMRKKY